MFSANFQALSNQLASDDNDTLERFAASGGWRKSLIDEARHPTSSSLFDFSSIFVQGLVMLLECMPPLGYDFRRALVAKDILDRKTSQW
jgi:hypothetical protein